MKCEQNWLVVVDGVCGSNQGASTVLLYSLLPQQCLSYLLITKLSCKIINIPPFLHQSASSQSCCRLLRLLLQVWLQCRSCPAGPAGSSAQPQRLGWALCYLYSLLPGTTLRRGERDILITILIIYKSSHTDLLRIDCQWSTLITDSQSDLIKCLIFL